MHLPQHFKRHTGALIFTTRAKTAWALIYMSADSQSILKLLFTGIGQQNASIRMVLSTFIPYPPLFSCHRLLTPSLLRSQCAILQASTPSTLWNFEAGAFPYIARNFSTPRATRLRTASKF